MADRLHRPCPLVPRRRHSCVAGLLTFSPNLKGHLTMKSLRTLRKAARIAAAERGHDLAPFQTLRSRANMQQTECRSCNAHVTVTTRPLPNEVDIGGSAVAVSCDRSKKILAGLP